MKKLLFVFVVFSLLLAACGAPKPAEAPPTTQGAAQTTQSEITFSMWGAPEELAVWKQIVADFEKANPNIKVNVEVSDWDSYWDKLKTQLAAGTPPDVFAMDAPLFLDYQSRGVLKNLQPYLDQNPDMLKDVYRATSRPSSFSTIRTCSIKPAWRTPPLTGPGMTCEPLPRA
jgi:multiple sugar transport system substrate-binding protein